MTTFKEIHDRRNYYGERISNQVRIIAIGLLAITWAVIIGETRLPNIRPEDSSTILIRVGTIAILVLFCDFAQYFFAYSNTQLTLRKMDKKGLKEGVFEYNWLYYIGVFFFWAKQLLLILGVLLFLNILRKVLG